MERNDVITTLEVLRANCSKHSRDYQALAMAISSLKTDEAYQLEYENRDCVEVVRCKDCKYYHVAWDDCNPTNDYSEYWCEYVSPNENDYCSLGERKEQEQTDGNND